MVAHGNGAENLKKGKPICMTKEVWDAKSIKVSRDKRTFTMTEISAESPDISRTNRGIAIIPTVETFCDIFKKP